VSLDDLILTRVSIDAALARLAPIERDVMRMLYAYDQPLDYEGQWPPTLAQVGRYVGDKHFGKRISEGRVAKIRDTVLARWGHGMDD
jgi:hypothetical protein